MTTLKELIEKSESIDNYEKEAWLSILPNMDNDKLERLKNIFQKEFDELRKLEEVSMEDKSIIQYTKDLNSKTNLC